MSNRKDIILLFIIFLCSPSFSQNKTLQDSGNVLLFVMPASSIGTTLLLNDTEGTWQFTKGFIVNQALVYGLKTLVSKERPDSSNYNSFPSGHTATTFQSATFIQKRYGWKYGIPAYALATFTGFTRIQAKKHDYVDCLSGAIIGIGSSYLFTSPYQKEPIELSFGKYEGGYILTLCYKF